MTWSYKNALNVLLCTQWFNRDKHLIRKDLEFKYSELIW